MPESRRSGTRTKEEPVLGPVNWSLSTWAANGFMVVGDAVERETDHDQKSAGRYARPPQGCAEHAAKPI